MGINLAVVTRIAVATCVASGIALPPAWAETSLGPDVLSARRAADAVRMLPGVVEPAQIVTMSVPMDGVLAKIHVTEGQQVIAGQELAVLDNRIAAESVRTAAATAQQQFDIRSAQVELAMARRYRKRLEYAHELEAASDLELDQSQERLEQAEANLAQARGRHTVALAQLELERARLASHSVTAPFSGRIVRIEGRCGQTMTQADTLLTLVNLETLRADLHVPFIWLGKLEVGQSYPLAADAPVQGPLWAKLVAFEPMIDAATKTFRCVFEIENAAGELPAGFAVRLLATHDFSKLTDSPAVSDRTDELATASH